MRRLFKEQMNGNCGKQNAVKMETRGAFIENLPRRHDVRKWEVAIFVTPCLDREKQYISACSWNVSPGIFIIIAPHKKQLLDMPENNNKTQLNRQIGPYVLRVLVSHSSRREPNAVCSCQARRPPTVFSEND